MKKIKEIIFQVVVQLEVTHVMIFFGLLALLCCMSCKKDKSATPTPVTPTSGGYTIKYEVLLNSSIVPGSICVEYRDDFGFTVRDTTMGGTYWCKTVVFVNDVAPDCTLLASGQKNSYDPIPFGTNITTGMKMKIYLNGVAVDSLSNVYQDYCYWNGGPTCAPGAQPGYMIAYQCN